MPHDTCCHGSDMRALASAYGPLTSLCELERLLVRRPLKRVGRVVLLAAPLLACVVPQSCWRSLCGIALCRRHHPNHRADMAVAIRNYPRCLARYMVTGRLRSSASDPTCEAAAAARADVCAATVCVWVCGCTRLIKVVCGVEGVLAWCHGCCSRGL